MPIHPLALLLLFHVQELARLQAEQKDDMLRMVHAFTTTQVMRAERDAEVGPWLCARYCRRLMPFMS